MTVPMDTREGLRDALEDLTGAMRFVLAFYEPGQRYLDTNAWKQAEAGARAAFKKAEQTLTAPAQGAVNPADDTTVNCARFVRWALQEGPWEGGDLDGGNVQDKAETLGLIVSVPYDPAKHGAYNNCGCDAGDPWFEFSPGLNAVKASPLQSTGLPAPAPHDAVSIKPMQLSDGRTDYFVSIKVGDREVTPHVFREEYKAAYHVALYDWLLNGSGEEPDVVEFGPDDWPARSVALAPHAEVRDCRPGEDDATYYSEGRDAEYFENLNDADFAWRITRAAQDIVDNDFGPIEDWMPITAMLDSAAKRIAALALPQSTERGAPVLDGGIDGPYNERRDDLGIVLSALRYLEEATGEKFDDEGGVIAEIERDHAAPLRTGLPASAPHAEVRETFVINNPDGSISLDAYAGMSRDSLKERCGELCRALSEWQFVAVTSATDGANTIENVREPYRSKVAQIIEAYSDETDAPQQDRGGK